MSPAQRLIRSLPVLAGLAALAVVAVIAVAKEPVTTAATQEQAPVSLAIGASIPMADVPMKGVDGKNVTIADVAGKKGTLVVFSCNACPWAQAWEERIAAAGNRMSLAFQKEVRSRIEALHAWQHSAVAEVADRVAEIALPSFRLTRTHQVPTTRSLS